MRGTLEGRAGKLLLPSARRLVTSVALAHRHMAGQYFKGCSDWHFHLLPICAMLDSVGLCGRVRRLLGRAAAKCRKFQRSRAVRAKVRRQDHRAWCGGRSVR